MVLYRIILSIVIVILVKDTYVKDVHFPIEKDLSYSIFETEPVLYGKSTRLIINGEYLVFLRGKSENINICSVFDYPSLNYIGDYGNFGRGPYEFPYPDVQNAVATDNGFAFFDMIKGLIFIDIQKLINKEDFICRQIRIPGELYMLNDAQLINDSIIIGMPYKGNSDNMYVGYNLETMHTEYFGEYPEIFDNKSSIDLWDAFWRHSCVKPDRTRLASFFDSQKLFRIYSPTGTLITEKLMEAQDEYYYQKYRNKEGITHYYKVVKSTNKYIYALCYNTKLKNFLETLPVIEVWDWDGNPVARFQMGNSILTFEITSDNEKIYCVDNEILDKIFIYDIGSILN